MKEDEAYIKVTLKSILESMEDKKIDFIQPLYEAISNSMEAQAENITVYVEEKPLGEDELNLGMKPKVCGFKIIDDGVGFTEKNLESFNEYLSSYKRAKGCKGVGHFTWLKVFEKVQIESYTSEKKVSFDFDFKYNPDNINIEDSSLSRNTTITFLNVTKQYQSKAIEADLESITDSIQEHFLVKLFLMNQKGIKFNITVCCGGTKRVIDNNSIPKLREDKFEIQEMITNDKEVYEFKLYYDFIDNKKSLRNLFYCGDGRTVRAFLNNIKIEQLPEKETVIMLLTSKYFDGKTNNVRSDFTFNLTDNNPSSYNPIPFPKINEELQKKIDEIILANYPELGDDNKKIVQDCIDEYPYLAKYIKQDTSLIKNKKRVVEVANRLYVQEKEQIKAAFAKLLVSKHIDNTEFKRTVEKVNDISSRELAQYFLYREQIINALGELNSNYSTDEEKLHTLFMSKGDISLSNEKKYYDTNIWLLDDKYMTYSEMFSDVAIKRIKEALGEMNLNSYGERKEPDLSIFYNTSAYPLKDLVVVEFKAMDVSPDRKIAALPEINRNLKFILNSCDNIRNMYGYIITKIDADFQEYIEAQPGVKKLFSTGNVPYYYIYNDNLKDKNGNNKDCHIYFISTNTVYNDAKSRNDNFINIIKNK